MQDEGFRTQAVQRGDVWPITIPFTASLTKTSLIAVPLDCHLIITAIRINNTGVSDYLILYDTFMVHAASPAVDTDVILYKGTAGTSDTDVADIKDMVVMNDLTLKTNGGNAYTGQIRGRFVRGAISFF